VTDTLEKLESLVSVCSDCSLCQSVNKRVFGEGNPVAKLMLIGEAPGRDENTSGRPFVGDAGKLLDKALTKLTIKRADLYIANILKCWPPGNRRPEDAESAACGKYLEGQIAAIHPPAILAMGASSANFLTKLHASIGKIRGKVLAGPHETKIVPTWHPSYILRCGGMNGSQIKQRQAARDFLEDLKLACDMAGLPWTEALNA